MPKASTKSARRVPGESKLVVAIKDKARRTGTLSPTEAEVIRAENAARADREFGQPHHGHDDNGAAEADPAFLPAVAFKVKKRVTVPVLRFAAGTSIIFKFSEKMRESEVADSDMGAATVAEVVSMSGEFRILIIGEVLRGELERAYPKDGYVGLWFHVTKLPPREGKRYADYAISEIEDPTTAL